ncbi:MAG: TonB-dependent receptor [Pseudomonadota bacterium]
MDKLAIRSLSVALSISTILSGTAYAQTSDGDAARDGNGDIIIVQATRRELPPEDLPSKIRLIDRQSINEQIVFSSSLFDIVGQKVPSLSPSRQKLSGVGESFRGREPLYLIDGVPQSNPLRNGSRDGFTIDPAVIERIEVLFGANAIQGVGATGGVINFVTLSPTKEDDWELRVEAGATTTDDFNNDGKGFRGAATVLRDFGAVDLVASIAVESRGAFYDADGRRIGVDGTQGDIQDSLSRNIFVKAGWDIDPVTRLQFTTNLFELEGDGDYIQIPGDRDAGIPATSIRGEQEGQAPTNTVNTFALDFTRSDLFGGAFSVQGFYREFESVFGGGTFGGFFNTGNEAPGELTFDQSANNSNKRGVKATYTHGDLPIEGLTVTGGVDWLRDQTFQELVQTGRLWVPETVFNTIAPFIQLDQQFFNDRVLISGGVRHEIAELQVDDFVTIFSSGSTPVSGGEPEFSETLFNVGGSVEVIEGLRAYASYAEGFTMPDVGRVLRAVNTPGQDVDSLLNIQPIIADNTEVGLSFDRAGFSANVAYFWSESDFGQRLFANDAGIFEVRREPTEIEGIEVSAEYAFDAPVVIGASYAALEGRSDQDDDGQIDEDLNAENISPDRLNAYISATVLQNWIFLAQVNHFFDRTFNDATTDTDFEGYTLVDLSAGYDFGAYGRVELGLQNAFNEDYVTYYSQSSPNAATRGDRFFTGRGRTLSLRWTATY